MYGFRGEDNVILNLIAATRLKKLGTGSYLPLCTRLDTEETTWWIFGTGMLSHSCLLGDSSCSDGLLRQIFHFMMCQMLLLG